MGPGEEPHFLIEPPGGHADPWEAALVNPTTAVRSLWIDRWFQSYTRRYLARSFHRVHVHCEEPRLTWEEPLPLLVCMNHSSWWDLLLGYYVGRRLLGWDVYAPMDAAQLRRYRFLRHVGVFGVERGTRDGARRFLRETSELLRGRRRALWLTPQGALLSNDTRPIRFGSGVGRLARSLGEGYLMTVAVQYEFWEEKLPEAFVSLGPLRRFCPATARRPRALVRNLEQEMTARMDALDTRRRARDAALFTTVLQSPVQVSPLYDTVRRLAARMRGEPFSTRHGVLR
jgi:1-acyl-sn-glycerol-3-phosphate acyltransferase